MEDLTGKKFGRWTVLEKTKKENDSRAYYKCKCDCGTIRNVMVYNLKSGTSLSCGCLKKENNRKNNTTHGESKTKLYKVWAEMKKRCLKKSCSDYENYGGRGITICDEWIDYVNFRNWSLLNGYKDNLSIDRINNDKGYNPNNCRWATRKEQMNNTRRNHRFEINNEKLTVTEIAKKCNKNTSVISTRIKQGYRNEELLKPYIYTGNPKYKYILINSEGKKYENTINIIKFCEKNNIKYRSLMSAFNKKRNFYKNWKINRVKINK
jgi:hypothetical protein